MLLSDKLLDNEYWFIDEKNQVSQIGKQTAKFAQQAIQYTVN